MTRPDIEGIRERDWQSLATMYGVASFDFGYAKGLGETANFLRANRAGRRAELDEALADIAALLDYIGTTEQELALANKRLDTLQKMGDRDRLQWTGDCDIRAYADDCAAEIERFDASIAALPPTEGGKKIIDLMEALKASLAKSKAAAATLSIQEPEK